MALFKKKQSDVKEGAPTVEGGVLPIPEVAPIPETGAEKPSEAGKPSEAVSKEGAPLPPPPTPQAITPPTPSKERILREIEDVLSDGLSDLYRAMPQELQAEFKSEGERTAARIREMVAKARIKARDVLRMIRRWLGMIPGVNKFFLEQEAKIKTDKIIELAVRAKQQATSNKQQD